MTMRRGTATKIIILKLDIMQTPGIYFISYLFTHLHICWYFISICLSKYKLNSQPKYYINKSEMQPLNVVLLTDSNVCSRNSLSTTTAVKYAQATRTIECIGYTYHPQQQVTSNKFAREEQFYCSVNKI